MRAWILHDAPGQYRFGINLPRLFFEQYEIIGSTMGSYEEFADVTKLIDAGVAVHIDRTYRLAPGEQSGKIVLTHPVDS
jgi:hypothetical protein